MYVSISDSSQINASTPQLNFAYLMTTVTHHIEDDIVSYLQHPKLDDTILAATSQQVVEIDKFGGCAVIVGPAVAGCSLRSNNHVFLFIKHISHANFSSIRDSSSSQLEFALIIADEYNHCLSIFDLNDYSMFGAAIGTCGVSGRLSLYTKYGISQVKLQAPQFVTTISFASVIRLAITCSNSNSSTYSLVVTFYPHTDAVYEYSHNGYVTEVNPFYPTLRPIKGPPGFCGFIRVTEASLDTQDITCSNDQNYIIPVLYYDQLLVADKGIKQLTWSDDSPSPVLTDIVVSNLLVDTQNDIDSIAPLSTSSGLIAFQQSTKTFYLLQFSPYNPARKHVHFVLASKNHPCNITWINDIHVSTVEMCGYYCVKTTECNAFSMDKRNQRCLLHTGWLPAIDYSQGTDCYKLGD